MNTNPQSRQVESNDVCFSNSAIRLVDKDFTEKKDPCVCVYACVCMRVCMSATWFISFLQTYILGCTSAANFKVKMKVGRGASVEEEGGTREWRLVAATMRPLQVIGIGG